MSPGAASMQMPASLSRVDDLGALMARVASAGDVDAFRTLYEHFAPRVAAYLRRSGCTAELAEELAQDVMATVWKRADGYDASRAQLSTWIFCVARNRMIDRVRSARRPAPDPQDPAWVGAPAPGPDAMLGQARDHARLHAAISALPAEQAAVLQASYVDGLSLAEYAVASGLPLGTVKTRARLAMQRLRTLLSPTPPEADRA